MFLKSDLLYLRALESTDLEFLYQLENNTAVWRVSNTVAPYSKEVLQLYLEQATADIYSTKQLRLMICTLAHQPVGVIDLYDFEPLHARAGVGIVIAEDYRKQQYAFEALTLLQHYCQNYLLLHQVYCTIAISNAASLKLFQNAGFTAIGLRKQWIKIPAGWEDVLEFQKILE
ncbi:GNAT family N-acetyltransferase [Adhaeribacter rhizoryzae]|uniref:GNAT family N-acetyltransferase n=1 Tax=Adhaeribacter rhizoryzae TaxID=2607907 RepID=A0A5M6DPN1_9BACT|nr:GNAT family N-acetyltransferase [Adhaeribacter rhizoryzae]KAA5549423.1 GNAT family N-acetyltransferase [Adhaeribacter rhizoryzae]